MGRIAPIFLLFLFISTLSFAATDSDPFEILYCCCPLFIMAVTSIIVVVFSKGASPDS